jgi:hypothetical protein
MNSTEHSHCHPQAHATSSSDSTRFNHIEMYFDNDFAIDKSRNSWFRILDVDLEDARILRDELSREISMADKESTPPTLFDEEES